MIEMNAHMVAQEYASRMVILGAVLCTMFSALAAAYFGRKNRLAWICILCAVASLALMIAGMLQPEVKEIRFCASEPVSLERIATVYDIVEIDGKELTVRER